MDGMKLINETFSDITGRKRRRYTVVRLLGGFVILDRYHNRYDFTLPGARLFGTREEAWEVLKGERDATVDDAMSKEAMSEKEVLECVEKLKELDKAAAEASKMRLNKLIKELMSKTAARQRKSKG
jgi:hypothetical protein